MTDLVLGADLSHYQHRPDFDRLVADGVRFVIIKATQGMWTDPDFDWNRNEAAKRGMPWLPYPFLTPRDTDAARKHFTSVVGARVPAALDWEEAGTPTADVELWMQACATDLGRTGLGYYGLWPPQPVTRQIATWPRWFPEYSPSPRLPAWDGVVVPNNWQGEWLIWQYTGDGRLPGVGDAVDLNRLACPWDVFKTWYDTGVLDTWSAAPAGLPLVPTGRTLHLNSSGTDVRALQRRLVALGYTVSADGAYGPETRVAVAAFQADNGLSADGIAGPETLAEINA